MTERWTMSLTGLIRTGDHSLTGTDVCTKVSFGKTANDQASSEAQDRMAKYCSGGKVRPGNSRISRTQGLVQSLVRSQDQSADQVLIRCMGVR